jgi:hypothetical protein
MTTEISNETHIVMYPYRGRVSDTLNTLPTRHTRWTTTWEDAQHRAEALCKKTYGDRGRVTVTDRDGRVV